MESRSFTPDAAKASEPIPMSRRKPLRAITVVQRLCKRIKKKLVMLMIQEGLFSALILAALTGISWLINVLLLHQAMCIWYFRRTFKELFDVASRPQGNLAQSVTRRRIARLMPKRSNWRIEWISLRYSHCWKRAREKKWQWQSS